MTDHYDVIVIGSGAGGGTLTHALAPTGKRILLLERGKMHDLDNLYVVDSSFFVSSTAVNPTLTIIANALRVADHIAGRLGAASLPEAQAEAQPLVTAHA